MKYFSFSNQWRFTGEHRWDGRKTISGALAYDEDSKEISFWQTSIEYKIGPAWSWIFSISGRDRTAKENETEFALSTKIFAF